MPAAPICKEADGGSGSSPAVAALRPNTGVTTYTHNAHTQVQLHTPTMHTHTGVTTYRHNAHTHTGVTTYTHNVTHTVRTLKGFRSSSSKCK